MIAPRPQQGTALAATCFWKRHACILAIKPVADHTVLAESFFAIIEVGRSRLQRVDIPFPPDGDVVFNPIRAACLKASWLACAAARQHRQDQRDSWHKRLHAVIERHES